MTGQYPGASADVVASTVVAPIEEQINGVENMLYVSSNSTADGAFSIAVTFDIGTNLDIAQVQVQNRVAIAQPRLPADVRNIGVTVTKSSPDLMMVVHLYSPDKSRDTLFISNYATLEIKDALTRVDGVGSHHRVRQPRLCHAHLARSGPAAIARPDRRPTSSLALQGQNVQVASGVLNQPPVDKPGAFQIAVQTLGRLADPDEFGEHRRQADRQCGGARARTSRRVELAAQDYSIEFLSRSRSGGGARDVPAARLERAGDRERDPRDAWRNCRKRFPPGVKYDIVYDPTQFIQQSVDAVENDHRRGDHPGRAGGHPVPADLARRRHSASSPFRCR